MKLFGCGDNHHHFEARYTEEYNNLGISHIRGCSPDELKALMTYKKYVHDICIKCGKIIKP
jgi:hypothetical protein